MTASGNIQSAPSDHRIRIYTCDCGKQFNITGYPMGYKFVCPRCQEFCVISDQKHELKAGNILDDFVIQKTIGRGGMGTVYLGQQISLERPVAIKVLKPEAASLERFIKRFSSEAKIAAQINHHNVIQIYFVGRKKDIFFIAMEYVQGKSVRQMINEKGPFSERSALEIILQASQGLQKAHQMNILHRDIKPDNLIIDPNGEVKIADFGLAMNLAESGVGMVPEKVVGSPHYISPEQATRDEISFASDIYSLGATLYHMVTGSPPFTGNSTASIIAKHVTDYPRSPRELNPKLSKPLCQMIRKMMAKRPEDRFQEIREIIPRLKILRDGKARHVETNGDHWFTEEKNDAVRLKEVMTIMEINNVIRQERDMDELLLRIVHEICLAAKAERGTLYIYDPEKQEIWTKVAEGLERDRIIRLPVGQGIAGLVAQKIRTEIVNDPYSHPNFVKSVDAMTGFQTRNMICMPVLGTKVELLGVIQLLNKKTGDFTMADASLVSALSVNIGLTLEACMYYCSLRPTCDMAL